MIFKLDTPMTFGKYKGKLISDVLDLDPEYLVWACDAIDWFELHHKAMEELMDVTMVWDEDQDKYDWVGHDYQPGERPW